MDWSLNKQQQMEYTGGKEDWERVNEIAVKCSDFVLDDEDELVADKERSCYNCRYRRWTSGAFACLKKSEKDNTRGLR